MISMKVEQASDTLNSIFLLKEFEGVIIGEAKKSKSALDDEPLKTIIFDARFRRET